jgi:hypothetical protein
MLSKGPQETHRIPQSNKCRNRVSMPVAGHPPHKTNFSPLHHYLRHPRRFRKIILSNQQVTLLSNAWRVAKPGANHMQWELALEFCLSAGPHRVEQSRPTRDPARRNSRVISVRRFEFFQPIAVLAAARYCGAATTYPLLSPKISNASSRVGRKECIFITRNEIGRTRRFPVSRPGQRWSSVQDQ